MSRRRATASQPTVSPCMIPLERMPSNTLWTMHPALLSSLLHSSSLDLWKHCPSSSTLSRQLCTGVCLTKSPSRSLILSFSPIFYHDFLPCPQPLRIGSIIRQHLKVVLLHLLSYCLSKWPPCSPFTTVDSVAFAELVGSV